MVTDWHWKHCERFSDVLRMRYIKCPDIYIAFKDFIMQTSVTSARDSPVVSLMDCKPRGGGFKSQPDLLEKHASHGRD